MSLLEELILNEGYRKDPYLDQTSNWTGGYGHKILPLEWNEFDSTWSDKVKKEYWTKKLVKDLSNATFDISYLTSHWKYQPNETQIEVLIELDFNLGLKGLIGFKKFLSAFSSGDIKTAAKELIDSKSVSYTHLTLPTNREV